MTRLNNNTYALKFEPDQEKQIKRQNHFKEHFDTVPSTFGDRKIKAPLSAAELSQLPVEMQRRAKYDQYKYVKDRMDESQETMLNYNEKIPMKVRYKMYWENRPNGPKYQEHKKDCGSF